MKKLTIAILLMAGIYANTAFADTGDYCDKKIRVTNSSKYTPVKIKEGWIFRTNRTLLPYENTTVCMMFGEIHSPKFEYKNPDTGKFEQIQGCPDGWFILHSINVNIKDRKDGSKMPYCVLN